MMLDYSSSSESPTLLSDLFLLQGYVLSLQGQCLFELVPSPELPPLTHSELAEQFSSDSTAMLLQQIEHCCSLPYQQPKEQVLSLSVREGNQSVMVFSCMTAVHIIQQQAELVLWRPIVLQRHPPWGGYSVTCFHQWLSLSVDHLWRLQRPFALLMFDIELGLSPPSCSLSLVIASLIRSLPEHAVPTQIAHGRFVILLPSTSECEPLHRALLRAFNVITQNGQSFHLATAYHMYRALPRNHPPSIQPINHLLLQRLADALKVVSPCDLPP